jgi:lysophospholipase L1-like esterase
MMKSDRSVRRRWRAWYWVAAACAAVALCAGVLIGTPRGPGAGERLGDVAQANQASTPPTQASVITTNIQGAMTTSPDDGNTDSKWTTMVDGLIQLADIVVVQEAGPSGPPSSRPQPDITTASGATVQHFQWTLGSENPRPDEDGQQPVSLAQVYFLPTNDPGNPRAAGGRVNLAIVTRGVPDQVEAVENPAARGRAALGVRFGNNWYFNVHGLAGSHGSDSGDLVAAIADAVHGWDPSYTYTIGGDFNLDPAALTVPAGARTAASGEPTHENGGQLDYFVTDDPGRPQGSIAGQARLVATQTGGEARGQQSDHYPVMLGGLQAGAGPLTLKVMNNGDSITGNTTDIARQGLATATLAAIIGVASVVFGRSVIFVGDEASSGGTAEEGAPGDQISAIASRDATAIPKYKPNVVLLQAGTWDIQDGNSAGAPDRLSALIDQIQAADPGVVVMVATLAPTTNAADEAQVTAYNTAVQQLAAARAAAGQHLVLADMSDLTTADLNADGITPNASGQQKMADSFTSALLGALAMGWIPENQPFDLEASQSAPSGTGATSAGTNPGVLVVDANTTSSTGAPGSYPTSVAAPSGGSGGGSAFQMDNCNTSSQCEVQDTATQYCLTAGTTLAAAPGSTVTAMPCGVGAPNQTFDLTAVPGGSGNAVQIRDPADQCLTYGFAVQGKDTFRSSTWSSCQPNDPPQRWVMGQFFAQNTNKSD